MIVNATSVIKELGIHAGLLHKAVEKKIIPTIKESNRVHPKFDSEFIKANREKILKSVNALRRPIQTKPTIKVDSVVTQLTELHAKVDRLTAILEQRQ